MIQLKYKTKATEPIWNKSTWKFCPRQPWWIHISVRQDRCWSQRGRPSETWTFPSGESLLGTLRNADHQPRGSLGSPTDNDNILRWDEDKFTERRWFKKKMNVARTYMSMCTERLYYYDYYNHLMAFFQDNLGKPAPERQTILDFIAARHDGVTVASAGPYANHLHLAPHS